LIVEDEGIIARDIQRQVEDLGYEVLDIAASAAEAFALARAQRPQLVLMDIHLWGPVDGIDAATQIRAELGIPSVFLTAYATDEVVERAKRAEPLGYIIKPFDAQSLRTTIEIALHKDRVDAELRRSEARYRAVVESAPDAVVTHDAEAKIVGWSRSAAELFGYTEAEILGKPLMTLMPAAQRDPHRQRMDALRESHGTGRRVRFFEVDIQRKDGEVLPAEISTAGWETPEGWFITAFVRDISERRRSQRTLRLQGAALDAAANAMVITDREGTIEWVNQAFTRATGYASEEAVGKNPRALVRSGAHDRAFYEAMWSKLSAGEVWVGELINRRKDGSTYTEEQTITPVLGADGSITHYIGVKRDLSEQKLLQAKLLQAQKMEVVGRLAGGVAHDFNNLLTVINGTAELAQLDLPEGDPMRAELQEILDSGARAARLTRQLLAFSRKQVLSPVSLDLSAQVKATASMLRRLIGEDISLVLSAAESLDPVLVDAGQLEQVVLNLAVNARDAMPGGGTLTIATRNAPLEDPAAARAAGVPPGRYVMLEVSDSGVGMSDEVRARIFEPFFTTKAHGKGTGLGLATVYGIVAQSGGFIALESALGKGSSFRIFLPRALGKTSSSARPLTSGRGTETILLVEDEGGPRGLAARMLRSAGYTVLVADGGAQALSLLADHRGPVHLLFTDVVMPGMSGVDLVSSVTAAHPLVKVLLTSGYTDDARIELALTRDPGRFIAKPYSVVELTGKVRSVLDEPAALA
jgi:PAS domain S-box-containing protein